MPDSSSPIYLDNAATSFPKPPEVAEAMHRLIQEISLSPGRSAHRFSLAASRVIFEARERIAEFFDCPDSSRVAFTSNVTEALNVGIFGLLEPGDHVLTTGMEHNSVMRPLRYLEKTRGIRLEILPTDITGGIDPDDIPNHLHDKTRLLIINHVSNVTGAMADLAAIGVRKGGALLMVDAAQSAGVFPLKMEGMGIDFLAFTGHKGLFGPPGTGGFLLREGIMAPPLKMGGTGSNSELEEQPQQMPDCFESGTPNTLGIGGLAAGLAFIQKTGRETIRRHEAHLTRLLLEGLSQIEGITVHGPAASANRGSAVSLTMAGKSVSDLAFLLDRNYAIMARAGLHCAPAAHRSIGTFPQGTLRLSPGFFNTEAEIQTVLAALKQISTT
ncbi:aminotransferase class V-fold PLP-dependent enzyme [Thiovibrio frasassiensis]|uniref:cysteine desulfurase n=1 Tax=Thiovibrio frasassiensis TaxID=2984131 RepID=A0A9X4MHC8_9BACT|nr:aminotransferase class V-fold PLP-dependent enzyme [Thiovibrio frasassiensis]MDG4475558.1 aminotransferase class V-fold PLP-dependent enzyme [Thiovibrio frasassiensis]